MAKGYGRKPKDSGYIIHETDEIVVVATGFNKSSANSKTGNMIQTWILDRKVNPVESVKTGQDKKVCFDCPYAGGNGCYVQIGNAPLSVYKKYRRGGYARLVDLSLVSGRKFRFGSYAEPVLIPVEIVRAIAHASAGWTGYTHQWRKLQNQKYRDFFMASTSDLDDKTARDWGWRTFCVTDREDTDAIMCPASKEAGKRSNCAKCGLCSGLTRKTARGVVPNVAKSIRIKSHGFKRARARKATMVFAAAA